MSGLEAPLRETLDRIAQDADSLRDPWWLIGSAAARLVGLDGPVRDVDLLISEADARYLLARWDVEPFVPEPSPVFHSRLFARRSATPVPVELMAGFSIHGEPLVPRSRLRLDWPSGPLFVPDIEEQITICRRFGREKDLARAERLEALLAK